MRKRISLLMTVLIALTALVVTPRADEARALALDTAIPPQVVDTAPARGEELPMDGSLTFYFDQAMDHTSVETAFSTSPVLKGSFTWPNDSTATFKPSTPLTRGAEYTFTLNATARSQAGATLKDTFTLKVQTGGNPAVAQILPANGAKDVEANPTITVIFTRPIVPLETAEQMSKLPSPMTLSPSADGQGEWLNTSIYTFKPTQLQGGTRYTITVHKGLTDVTGGVLQNDVVASFTTVSPRVIDITPKNNNTQALRDVAPVVTFSQPMDTAATQGAFTLIPTPKGQPVAGDFSWNDKKDTLTFKPKALLDYGQNYSLKIDSTKARSSSGGLLQSDATSSFEVVRIPDIIATDPGNGDTQAKPYGGFEVSFSAPMQIKDYKSHVTIDPKPGAFYDDMIDDNGFFYRIGFGTEPSTPYTISIDPKGLVDVYGTPLTVDPKNKNYNVTSDGKIQVKYTTAAYPPEASLQTGGTIGLYSAYNAQTRVYSTHRNISQIELSLYSVPLQDFLNLAGSNSWDFRNKYAPQTFLRRWNVPVANPTNVLRYDLLSISDQGPNLGQQANVACPGAPSAHIHPGDTVVVLRDDPTPQRVRDSAGLTGNIVATLKPGAVLHVVSGPICSDKYLWWQVTTSDGSVTGWTAEGDPTHYFIGPQAGSQPGAAKATPTQAAQAQTNTPAGSPLKAGFYWLQFDAPELPADQRSINHLMIVATANVTLKVAEKSAFAWVTDLQSGKGVPNANVQFYENGSSQIGSARTDANGVALMALPGPLDSLYTDISAVVNDGTNFGASASNMTDGIEPFDFNQETNFYPQNMTVYLYTDRPLYRPAQPVYFRGVVRSRDDVTYGLSNLKTIPVKIVDDQDKTVFQKDEPVSAFGTFSDSFTLDANAPLGYYRVVASPPTPKTVQNAPEFSQGFNVAEYRLPQFKVTTAADQPQVVQGDKVRVKVNSAYFFGGAVSNADISWSVTSSPYFFNYTGSGSYSFVDFNEDAGPSQQENPNGNTVSEGNGKTDAQGEITIEIPADLGKNPQSQTFTVEARVTDESAQVVAGRSDVIVNQGLFYIGVRPEQYVGTAGQPQKVDLISVGWDSKPMPGQDLAIKVVERVWKSVQTVEPSTGRTVWTYDVKENPVTDGTVHTDQDGKGVFTFTPPHGGDYKVYATSRDSRGNQITSSAFAWIAGPDYVPWRQENSNRVELKLDKTDYKIGDTAQVLIASPFQGEATALVSVERGKMLKAEVISMTTNSTIYKLPITPDMAPNAYVSVMIVKGVDAKNPVAAFHMGLSQIGVETERLKLNIQISSDKAQAGPRDKVNYTLHVSDYQGKPVQAEVGLAMVDEAALSLLPDQSTPILDHFYGKQGLGIRTANTLTLSVDQQTQQIINTVKGGGGGGGGAGENGIFTVRQEFITTPVWSPSLTTDSSGNANLTITLPDNLTTWKLDARAVTQPSGELNTTLVGQTTSELLSTKPLLIRPVTPRFFVAGDSSTLTAVVNNNTDQAQDVTVRVDVTGAALKGSVSQKGNIPAKGRMSFAWPIDVSTANDVNAVGVTFFANSADNKYTDAAKSDVGQGSDKTLPIMRYEAPETVGTGGMITKAGGSATEGIVLPRDYTVTQGSLDIKLDPSLAATTTDALNVLRNYPYQCLEQTISRFLPNLMTYAALKKLNLAKPDMQAQLTDVINYALQRLYSEQHTDGGWGWFLRDVSDPLMTAYAVIGLSEAKNDGFPVDNDSLAKAVRYVQNNLQDVPDQAERWQLNRQSFLLYALARANSGNFSRAVRLFNVREKMSTFARAYLALTFHLMNAQEKTYTTTLMSDLQTRAITSATGQHWEEDYNDYWNWNTDTRTTAIALDALVQIQPTSALIPNVVRWLMVARKADAWETTQETAWAVMSLTDWMQYSGELKPNYTFSASLNDKTLGAPQQATADTVRQSVDLHVAVTDLLANQVNKVVVSRTSGDGVLYYTAHLTAYLPVEQIKPLSRGISITRQYSLQADKNQMPITQAKVGDVIRVTLTIVAPSSLNYVVINDPIPAGTEALNPDLATTPSGGQPPELRLQDPLSTGWGWWWFDNTELRDDRTVLYASYLPAGTYQYTYAVQAGMAGTYKVIPATGQEFYFPEVYGRSDGSTFVIMAGSAPNSGQ